MPNEDTMALYNCTNFVSVTFRGSAPTNTTYVDSAQTKSRQRRFLDTFVQPGVSTTNETKSAVIIYTPYGEGWERFASPITSEDANPPPHCFGVYVTNDGERKGWMCYETAPKDGWTYDPATKLLTDGVWRFEANVISNTFLDVIGHAPGSTNDTITGELDLKDKPIYGTDGKGYTIHKWSLKFDYVDGNTTCLASKVSLPSSIREINNCFMCCTNLYEFNFESEFVKEMPDLFLRYSYNITNGIVRLPNVKRYNGSRAFATSSQDWVMDIRNLLPPDLEYLGALTFNAAFGFYGDVVLTNLVCNTNIGNHTFRYTGINSFNIIAPNAKIVENCAF